MRAFSLLLLLALATSISPTASAHNAARINEGLASMRGRAEHLQKALAKRALPRSIVDAPTRVIRSSLKRDLGPRLETGLTADARVTIDALRTRIEADGNRTTRVEANVRLTAQTASCENVSPTQYVQSTSETRQANRDPRHGVMANETSVRQWKTSSNQANNGWVWGPGKLRTTTPIAQGLHFRGERLPAGSHLVTVRTQDGKNNQQLGIHFGNEDLPSGQVNGFVERAYLLRPSTHERLRAVKLNAQEAADLAAHQPLKAFRIHDGEAVAVHPAGYDHASLREGGFVAAPAQAAQAN